MILPCGMEVQFQNTVAFLNSIILNKGSSEFLASIFFDEIEIGFGRY